MRVIFLLLSSFAFSEPVYILDTPTRQDLLTTIGDLKKWQNTLQENLETAEMNSELLSTDLESLRDNLSQVTASLLKSENDLRLSLDSLTNIEKELQKAQTSLTQLSKDLTALKQSSVLWNLLIGSVALLTGLLVGLIF